MVQLSASDSDSSGLHKVKDDAVCNKLTSRKVPVVSIAPGTRSIIARKAQALVELSQSLQWIARLMVFVSWSLPNILTYSMS